MTPDYEIIHNVLQQAPCCEICTISVKRLDDREWTFFQGFMPLAKTVIVLGHHVTTEEEWTWYATGDGGEHCAADDHTTEVCRRIKEELDRQGFPTQIVQYPGESGLQFRFVARSAGMGEIGRNAFLLHPEWGPWIHLRVIASEAPIEFEARHVDSVCNNCGECLSACPAGAIADDGFDGLTCRSFRKSRGEYTPVGPKRKLSYCEICAQVCPIGDRPQKRQ